MLYPLDDKGCVINEASFEKINLEYAPLVEYIVSAFRKRFDKKILSIYVRGSVSVGRAQPNISDLDIVVIFGEPLSDDELKWRTGFARQLETKYSFVTMVDLTCIMLNDLLQEKGYKKLRVYLATQSVCLYGNDILSVLGKVQPNKDLALEMYQGLDEELASLIGYFSNSSEERSYLGEVRPPHFWCIWAMRALLRSGLGLVMCRRPVYSQDLETCFIEFTREFPNYKQEMKRALIWAHNPINDKEPVVEYLHEFAPKYLELWEHERRESL